jgi:hypothetical protein
MKKGTPMSKPRRDEAFQTGNSTPVARSFFSG